MDKLPARFTIVKKMEEDVGRSKWDQLNGYFSDDFRYTVANLNTKNGIVGLKEYMQWQNSRVQWKGHEVHLIAEKGDALIVEVTSFFFRIADGHDFSMPCTDIYRFRGDKIYDWRVYADISAFKNESL
ncbi:MAG: nuclear transport factor 2 family protein [Cytophagales bacterium]|nr:nuclear transport factor 2 family protein [Cytophagales bacterium]